jgi:hypothetical protein
VSRPDVLARVRADVKANKGAAGVDEVDITDIGAAVWLGSWKSCGQN